MAALVVALLAACSTSGPPHRYFVLEGAAVPASAAVAGSLSARDATLLVAPVSASSFYRTRELAYSKAAGTRAYYQYSSWTEPPPVAIGGALMTRLEGSGAFRTVAPVSSGLTGSLLLRVHLDEMYHDATASPGVARIVLTAQLSNVTGRTIVAKRSFVAEAPATSYDADGAVAGIRQALDAVLADLVSWIAAQPRGGEGG